MTLSEIKEQVREYYYMEDDSIIDISLACIIANRLQLGEPVWLIIIGESSGGKSQILRPLAMTDEKYIHKLDDITENTFLSGANLGKDEDGERIDVSLLSRIGKAGMLSISDLTVLFSRNQESRNAILSQFRMIYDGEMTKRSGNNPKPIHWSGYIGVIAGSTPSIYTHFEEVSDMGERFMYYRLKPYDQRKATQLALSRDLKGKELDEHLSEIYAGYIKGVVTENKDVEKIVLLPEQIERIIDIAMIAERVRTVTKINKYTSDVERIPTTAMPMRTALQFMNVAKALRLMRGRDLDEHDMDIIQWMGMSLANEEKRAVLYVMANETGELTTQDIGDQIGLSTAVAGTILQNLASTKVITRISTENQKYWRLDDQKIRGMFFKNDVDF